MSLKNFDEFLAAGIVKKQTPNKHRAFSLSKEAEDKKQFLDAAIKNISAQQMHFNFIVDSSYDIIMELIRAKMFIDGYNAGNSHQAEVSYMKNIGFFESDARFMDEIRYYRNGIKYYGTTMDKEYAEKVFVFLNKIYPQLKQLLKIKKQISIPSKEECIKLLKSNNVPDNIIAHTKKVCDFSMEVCDVLEKRSIKVNRELVAAAALLHDIKKLEPGEHEVEGAKYISSLGYPEVGILIKKHGLKHCHLEEFHPITWEEKIIFYSDKRVKNDKVVSVDERFEYIKQRYDKDNVEKEISFTKKIEFDLLGDEKL